MNGDTVQVVERTLVVHRDVLEMTTGLLPPGTEMRVKSLLHLVSKQDSGEELRAPGGGVNLRIGTSPTQVSRDDMRAILDALEAHGHGFEDERRDVILDVLDPDARPDDAARRDRAARRVLMELHTNFSQEIDNVPIGRVMLACRDIVTTVLDHDHDPLVGA
jgi:plasmid stability protein